MTNQRGWVLTLGLGFSMTVVTIAPQAKPDAQGLVHWELTLKPGEKREFRIAYQVEYPPELVIETNRRRMMEPAPAPSSPYAPTKSKIEDQILDLENSF